MQRVTKSGLRKVLADGTSLDIANRLSAAVGAQRSGDWPEAERLNRAILAVAPRTASAHHGLGNALLATGRSRQAEAAFRTAVELAPASPASRYGLSQALLAQGRYREAQVYLASRHDIAKLGVPRRDYAGVPWAGEDLAGKQLLIFPEQGLGDQIMMARFAPRLQAAGADVTLLCQPTLMEIFSALGVRVVAAEGAARFPKPDYWTTVMDLPGLMGLDGDDVSSPPYLAATQRSSLGEGFHVGVATNGNPAHPNDGQRSLFGEDAARLNALPGVIHSLAPQDGRNLAELAALIAGLDLVISVDSAMAHLAGALGAPVWILVPSLKTDWRWGERGSQTTPWYGSASLFWSAPDGAWSDTIQRVTQRLQTLLQPRPGAE